MKKNDILQPYKDLVKEGVLLEHVVFQINIHLTGLANIKQTDEVKQATKDLQEYKIHITENEQ